MTYEHIHQLFTFEELTELQKIAEDKTNRTTKTEV